MVLKVRRIFFYLFKFSKKIKYIKKKSFLVAVSGGPDSLALTAFLKLTAMTIIVKFYYVLIDHKLEKILPKRQSSVKKLLKKIKLKSLHIIKNKIKIKKKYSK